MSGNSETAVRPPVRAERADRGGLHDAGLAAYRGNRPLDDAARAAGQHHPRPRADASKAAVPSTSRRRPARTTSARSSRRTTARRSSARSRSSTAARASGRSATSSSTRSSTRTRPATSRTAAGSRTASRATSRPRRGRAAGGGRQPVVRAHGLHDRRPRGRGRRHDGGRRGRADHPQRRVAAVLADAGRR